MESGIITGELKNRIDRLREMFRTCGLTNPLEVIKEMLISYEP